MVDYLVRKLLYSLLVIWGVVTVVFLLFDILPGDPARMIAGQRTDKNTLKAIRTEMGLDKPVHIRYMKYLNDLSPVSFHSTAGEDFFYLDHEKYNSFPLIGLGEKRMLVLKWPYLGRSYQSRKSVGSILAEAIPNSAILAMVSILFAFLLGTFTGIIAAIVKDSFFDKCSLVFSALGMSLPSFFAAILIGWLFAYVLSDITGLNLTGNLYEMDDFGEGRRLVLKNIILPALTLGIRPLAVVVQLSRNSMLDVLSRDYIRTARVKGLAFSRIIFRHALKNSLNPLITAVSGWFASLMAGVIFVEYIFGWKGLGYVIVNALNFYDFPVVIGAVITISFFFVLINLLVDSLYGILDPRVRH